MARQNDMNDRDRVRGLPAVQEIRANRKRGKYGRPTATAALFALLGSAVVLGAYWFFWSRAVTQGRKELLAAQAAATAKYGPEWTPVRDAVEALVKEGRGGYLGDTVAPEARTLAFQGQPGLYLRMRAAEPGDVPTLAERSLKDGFTSCLVRGTGAPVPGAPPGLVGADQPWNLRQAYRATRVLTEGWRKLVEGVDDDLRLKVFQEQFEKAEKTELPLALTMTRQAKYFLLVLDEDVPEARIVEPPPKGDAGAPPRTTLSVEDLALVAHPARVFLYDFASKKLLARMRLTSVGQVQLGPEVLSSDPEVAYALRRQVNSCQLARDFVEALAPKAP